MNRAIITPGAVTAAPRYPWTAIAIILGSTSIIAGVIWDISWHSAVGRDTFSMALT